MIPSTFTYANAAISTEANIFQAIHLPERNIVIYQRDIEPLRRELAQMEEQAIEFRGTGSSPEILSQLSAYLNPLVSGHSSLLDDVAGLLRLFEQTTQVASFRLLLATVSTNMCRKFHTDVNDVRLLCTYVGPGTLWIPDEALDQRAAARDEPQIDPALIQQAGTGEAVLLKGALYPGGQPILHRSPTIEEQGEQRLLLRIDTNASLSL
ncbi:MAG: DUF1826 domain-containing protein [Bacteroidota bacterium]